ncbi:NUDIX domain-containing protein [Sesbania bispinosa]|nr:NUDIX domain-containing protein [Sesbania bispinosa]
MVGSNPKGRGQRDKNQEDQPSDQSHHNPHSPTEPRTPYWVEILPKEGEDRPAPTPLPNSQILNTLSVGFQTILSIAPVLGNNNSGTKRHRNEEEDEDGKSHKFQQRKILSLPPMEGTHRTIMAEEAGQSIPPTQP